MSEILKTDTIDSFKQLFMMVGLPYSGKSTEAALLSKVHHAPIVNPDSVRVALHGHKFIPEAEPYVWAICKTMVRSLFTAGHDYVILDATNLTPARRNEWTRDGWTTVACIVDTSLEVCLKRAEEAGDLVMLPIIEKMHEQMDLEGCYEGD